MRHGRQASDRAGECNAGARFRTSRRSHDARGKIRAAVLLGRSRSRPGRGTSYLVVPLLVLCAGTAWCRGLSPVESPSRGLPRSFPSQLADTAHVRHRGPYCTALDPCPRLHPRVTRRGRHFSIRFAPSQHARSPLPSTSTYMAGSVSISHFSVPAPPVPVPVPVPVSSLSLTHSLRSLRFPPPRSPSGSPDLF